MNRYTSHLLCVLCSVVFLNLFGCEKTPEKVDDSAKNQELQAYKITSEDISKIEFTDYALSNAAEKITQNWPGFVAINNHIEYLKQGDLSFFKDDKTVLKSTIEDLKNDIPEQLDTTPIEVRLIALETTSYKLEGAAVLSNSKKEDVIHAIKDVLISHTNLVFQINRKLEKDAQKIIKPY